MIENASSTSNSRIQSRSSASASPMRILDYSTRASCPEIRVRSETTIVLPRVKLSELPIDEVQPFLSCRGGSGGCNWYGGRGRGNGEVKGKRL